MLSSGRGWVDVLVCGNVERLIYGSLALPPSTYLAVRTCWLWCSHLFELLGCCAVVRNSQFGCHSVGCASSWMEATQLFATGCYWVTSSVTIAIAAFFVFGGQCCHGQPCCRGLNCTSACRLMYRSSGRASGKVDDRCRFGLTDDKRFQNEKWGHPLLEF